MSEQFETLPLISQSFNELPPLPPIPNFFIFDDDSFLNARRKSFKTVDSSANDLNAENDESTYTSGDEDEDAPFDDDDYVSDEEPVYHPDDVLKGHSTSSWDRPENLYLVYNARMMLLKVGITKYSYEECYEKYTSLYGHLDSFNFYEVENGILFYIINLFKFYLYLLIQK